MNKKVKSVREHFFVDLGRTSNAAVTKLEPLCMKRQLLRQLCLADPAMLIFTSSKHVQQRLSASERARIQTGVVVRGKRFPVMTDLHGS